MSPKKNTAMPDSTLIDRPDTQQRDNRYSEACSARQIRVVMVTTGFPTAQNPGSGIFNFRAARSLSQLFQVQAVHLRTWLPGRPSFELSEWHGIPRITVTAPQIPTLDDLNLALYRRMAWRQLSSVFDNCDLVHSVGLDFASVLASAWAKRAGVRHLAQVIGSDLNGPGRRVESVAAAIQNTHAVACNSAALQADFLRRYPEARNVAKVYRGVDLQTFHPDGPVEGPLAQRPPVRFLYLGGFPNSRKLSFGRNTKGGETLLAAWKSGMDELAAAGASLLVANVLPGDPYVEKWRMGVKFPGQVAVTGPLPPESVPNYLRACDAVLVPSLQEGLPNVATEALASGRPVFGTTAGGLPELIRHGQSGLILPPGDVAALKGALTSYARRVFDLRTMGQEARHHMETGFDASDYPLKMGQLYKLALEETV